jgi:hypothetical protein
MLLPTLFFSPTVRKRFRNSVFISSRQHSFTVFPQASLIIQSE